MLTKEVSNKRVYICIYIKLKTGKTNILCWKSGWGSVLMRDSDLKQAYGGGFWDAENVFLFLMLFSILFFFQINFLFYIEV